MALPKLPREDSAETPVIKKVASIPKSNQKEPRMRVEVCNDGTAGPYILCDPGDMTKLRSILMKRKIEVSFDGAVITDGETKGSLGGLVNILDVPVNDLPALQKLLDNEFPT